MKSPLLNKIFIACFLLMLIVPILFTNRDGDAISEKENRPLAYFPHLHKDGSINMDFTSELEDYLNDRIGFRNELILLNGRIQYDFFRRMENPEKYRLGPGGEFNIIENDMVETYQHKNLYTEEKLRELEDGFQEINDYLKSQGCDFYFMECYDKQSLYPEYFPDSVLQYGNQSKTDQFMETLKLNTDVKVIDLKPLFLQLKDKYEIYGKYSDPVHWTPRGAYIGYQQMLNNINSNHENRYNVLSEDDYDITITDQGMVFYGGITHTNMSEAFERKKTNAISTENCYDKYPAFEGVYIKDYVNDKAGNDTKLLILGNSFIKNYILDDIAESFGETLFVRDDVGDLKERVECFQPDIVIYQEAERYAGRDSVIGFTKDN